MPRGHRRYGVAFTIPHTITEGKTLKDKVWYQKSGSIDKTMNLQAGMLTRKGFYGTWRKRKKEKKKTQHQQK